MSRARNRYSFTNAMIALALTLTILVVSLPANVFTNVKADARAAIAAPAAPVAVNRTVPAVEPVAAFPSFSTPPTDDEISHARVFEEPLIKMTGSASARENQALGDALLAYLHK